jgi:dethiobiotin synthetase
MMPASSRTRTLIRLSTIRTQSSYAPPPPTPPPGLINHRAHLVFGANTDVGKSIVSAGLVRAAALAAVDDASTSRATTSVNYIKPLQCGGSDENFVMDQRRDDSGIERVDVACRTLFSWKTPASPHLACRLEGMPVCDAEVVASLRTSLEYIQGKSYDATTMEEGGPSSVTIIETAGGALSPSSSSPLNDRSSGLLGDGRWGWSTQADLYKSLHVPVVFVGDGKLGGIGVTLASLEALWSRGYRVDAVVFVEGGADASREGTGGGILFGRGNANALQEYVMMHRHPSCLEDDSIICLSSLPPMPLTLTDWYGSNQDAFLKLHRKLNRRWKDSFAE